MATVDWMNDWPLLSLYEAMSLSCHHMTISTKGQWLPFVSFYPHYMVTLCSSYGFRTMTSLLLTKGALAASKNVTGFIDSLSDCKSTKWKQVQFLLQSWSLIPLIVTGDPSDISQLKWKWHPASNCNRISITHQASIFLNSHRPTWTQIFILKIHLVLNMQLRWTSALTNREIRIIWNYMQRYVA